MTIAIKQIIAIAESMFYGDIDDASVARNMIERPEARTCDHWDRADVVRLAEETGIAMHDDADDDGTFDRIAAEYSRIADEYAANNQPDADADD